MWIKRGSLNIHLLRQRYVPKLAEQDDRSAIAAVRSFLVESAAMAKSEQIGRQHRAGTEGIMAAACCLREPLYIYDVLSSHAVHVQMYHRDVVSSISEEPGECVRIRLLDSATAHRQLVTQLNYRACPLVLAWHHAEGGEHFSGVRVEAHCYTQWNDLSENGESVADTLRIAHHALGIPVFQPWTSI